MEFIILNTKVKENDVTQKALIYTGNLLTTTYAKTAHGLIRGSKRFEAVAIIDAESAGQDAGTLLDGVERNIPIYASLEDAKNNNINADVFVVGVATQGGQITAELKTILINALESGLDVVCGLHSLITEDEEIVAAAQANGRQLFDVRKPKKASELHFWSGDIKKVNTPIVAVLGTDCAVGKRTTAKMITEDLAAKNKKACMVYTGQTGWLQGWKHGFIFDSTPNDFVSGELEHAILECIKDENPSVVLLEGQSALRNPSGPCGAEYLLSANAKHVVLQVAPARDYFIGLEDQDCVQHSVASEIKLIEAYGSKVIGITINSENLNQDDIAQLKKQYSEEFNIPVVAPMFDKMDAISDAVFNLVQQ
ncbi:MAG TPA: DUF1611 domain-containing protein [Gammaproteobacteria bacterium]|nr:hypothetical protein [Gammaproteobacteria bacterium]HCK92909.1 DUF1611 domain-containing protein [Gammaproteobacteria bacterium]|tara:strand:+ start:2964 stop:4061 length:1098 start_codon:yes stop_codon:yes gene_type:complete